MTEMDALEAVEFEIGMITYCNLAEGMSYEDADIAARNEYRMIKAEQMKDDK